MENLDINISDIEISQLKEKLSKLDFIKLINFFNGFLKTNPKIEIEIVKLLKSIESEIVEYIKNNSEEYEIFIHLFGDINETIIKSVL